MCLLVSPVPCQPMAGQGNCVAGLVNDTWPCNSQVELLRPRAQRHDRWVAPQLTFGGGPTRWMAESMSCLGKRDGTWMIDVTVPSTPSVWSGILPSFGSGQQLVARCQGRWETSCWW